MWLLLRVWGRNKGISVKSLADGLKDVFGILTSRRDIAANTPKALGTLKCPEPTRHLLFDFHHPDIPLPLVVIKRHAKIRHERQHLTLEVTQTDQQVHWWRLFGTPAFFCVALGGGHGNGVGLK